ncbi:MAG: BrnA antitoxin family protein [Peptococcaceae bacterium]|jgi:uncharacterized protein (DUF4415 family)|nr:BrnA antitoxin family protein [Peptococcaceae bacterium]
MADADIDFSENPILDEDFWAEAIRWPGPKKQITLRVDPDILDFFRKQGRGYQTTINSVLRQYVDVQRRIEETKRHGRPGKTRPERP